MSSYKKSTFSFFYSVVLIINCVKIEATKKGDESE